jgi:hypothetical protein
MKKAIPFIKFLFTIVLLSTLFSCTDNCEVTRTYRQAVPVTWTLESIRAGVRVLPPAELENPAKLYIKDNFLLISEAKKGIHIIDNSNPSSPIKLSFLEIPGAVDMAVKNNTLYVDSYMDVVALDISDPKKVIEVGRQKNIFQNGLYDGLSWYYDAYSRIVTDYEWKTVTETIKTDCGASYGSWPIFGRGEFYDGLALSSSKGPSGSTGTQGSSGNGTGGSMARFAIYKDYLYTVSQNNMTLFNIQNESKPDSTTTINLGWGIETIFPYKDKLFIGSNTGMHIYDNSNPKSPQRLSIFQHARACDPVVVEGDIAYVTLREGWCGAAPNRLDIVNIADLTRPVLIKSYEMENPHGLGIDNGKLFICEGKFGLKSYDANNTNDIKLQEHIKDINAFDVIPMAGNLLLMVGADGFYQYDYSDPKNLKLLSKITVVKN